MPETLAEQMRRVARTVLEKTREKTNGAIDQVTGRLVNGIKGASMDPGPAKKVPQVPPGDEVSVGIPAFSRPAEGVPENYGRHDPSIPIPPSKAQAPALPVQPKGLQPSDYDQVFRPQLSSEALRAQKAIMVLKEKLRSGN